MVVWRRREDNPWMYEAQKIVESMVARPETYDEPTCGPGPFSMANADTVSDILMYAGFTDIDLRRCELPITVGNDLEHAIDLAMALGPGGEILRLQGDRAADLHEPVRAGAADRAGPVRHRRRHRLGDGVHLDRLGSSSELTGRLRAAQHVDGSGYHQSQQDQGRQ